MSALPLISHHLFVAAIDRPGPRRPKQRPSAQPVGKPSPISLELLDWDEALPELTPRPIFIGQNSASA